MPAPYSFENTDPNITVKDNFWDPMSQQIKTWWDTTSVIHTNYTPSKFAQSLGNAAGATIQNYTVVNPSMVRSLRNLIKAQGLVLVPLFGLIIIRLNSSPTIEQF